jgi:RNA chaperone Hfq
MVIPARRFKSKTAQVAEIKNKLLNQQISTIEELQQHDDATKLSKGQLTKELFAEICKRHCAGSIYMISGIRLQGIFHACDSNVVILESLDRANKQMVYQHAIATIILSEI